MLFLVKRKKNMCVANCFGPVELQAVRGES